ncbi:hypothetical protein AMECASPLE_038399 [Ameca splendens]|uniref:Uncharacterized protein n=1 Tax=Ameca splendens TaxID=208324 RepID=A0ABV0ZGW1_9TELE
MRNCCSRLNQQGNSSPWKQTSVGFHLHRSVDGVFDRFMNLLTFLYQTEFQFSSSSGNDLVEKKCNSPVSFCCSRSEGDTGVDFLSCPIPLPQKNVLSHPNPRPA